jgi:hypothetical protein
VVEQLLVAAGEASLHGINGHTYIMQHATDETRADGAVHLKGLLLLCKESSFSSTVILPFGLFLLFKDRKVMKLLIWIGKRQACPVAAVLANNQKT